MISRTRALALVLLVSLTACTSGGGTSTDSDLLRINSAIDPPGLNPLVTDNAQVTDLSPLIHGFLLRADGAGRLIPDLATAVPSAANGGISRDGRTVTYHLRRGVRWHDGVAFDARDVVFSYRAVMNPANNVPDRTGFDRVVGIETPNPYTVRVHLRMPFSPFVASFLTLGANDPYPILPAHLLATKHDLNHDPYDAKPVGLGPYKVVAWDRGSQIDLAADPQYFRGAPGIGHIRITIVPNVNTVQTLWQGGKLDFIAARPQAGRAFLDAVRATPGTHVVLTPHNEFDFVIINTAHPPLDDIRVRRALVQGINRIRIMHDLNGELSMPGDGDRLPGAFAYDPSLQQPRYDAKAAAASLDGAGWPLVNGVRTKNGKPLDVELIATTESPTTTRFSLLAQQDLAKLGIHSTIKQYGYNQLWAVASEGGIYKSGRFDLSYSGWQPNAVNDHSYLFRCDTRAPAGDNLGRICDPVIEAAARTELETTDPVREANADRALTRRLVAQSDLIFLGFPREGVAYRDGLEGVRPSILGLHLWNAWSWHWRR
jgi:peptide/nickel transport system substrate-binding protein